MIVIHKAKVTSTSKIIGLLLILYDAMLARVVIKVFKEYFINFLHLKLDTLTATIVGGFFFLIIFLLLASTIFLIPGEYKITDNELIIRTWLFIKYVEREIPYTRIEKIFPYILWDFRGHESFLILVKLHGELKVDFLYPLKGTLIFLNPKHPRKFLHDINVFTRFHVSLNNYGFSLIKAKRFVEGKVFKGLSGITIGVLFILFLPIILLVLFFAVHFLPMGGIEVGLITFIVIVAITAITLIPSALDMIQNYIITREGLYIRKLSATIFIPRNTIQGFIYMDTRIKSKAGGGLIRIGDTVTIINVKKFNEFLETMKEYGYRIHETD